MINHALRLDRLWLRRADWSAETLLDAVRVDSSETIRFLLDRQVGIAPINIDLSIRESIILDRVDCLRQFISCGTYSSSTIDLASMAATIHNATGCFEILLETERDLNKSVMLFNFPLGVMMNGFSLFFGHLDALTTIHDNNSGCEWNEGRLLTFLESLDRILVPVLMIFDRGIRRPIESEDPSMLYREERIVPGQKACLDYLESKGLISDRSMYDGVLASTTNSFVSQLEMINQTM